MDGWREVNTSTAATYGSMSTPQSAVQFDSFQELLWTGDTNGRVTSFASEPLRKYTSFISHSDPVSQILVGEKGVISLGANNIKMSSRRGLSRFNLKDDVKFKDLTCMSYTSRGTSEIVVGSKNETLLKVNADRGAVTSEIQLEEGLSVMRKGGRLICAGNLKGEVVLMDPNSLTVVKKFPAHSGGIVDLDSRENVLVTCGHTQRGSAYLLDPLLNIFDLRSLRPQAPIPFPAGAGFVRLHPKISNSCIVSSVTGQIQILDFFNPAHTFLHQANLNYVTGLDISSSGDYFALSDGDGAVHLWGSPEAKQFTDFARPIEWPDQIMDHIVPTQVDDEVPLNSIGMPYYKDKLLSAWPNDMIFNVGGRSPGIDPEILGSMKMVDFVGYAPFPRRQRRYVTETSLYFNLKGSNDLKTPMFRSEQEKLQSKGNKPQEIIEETDPVEIFKKVEMKYSRFGVDDFDFGFYNKTKYAGLETHLQNSYTNAILQLYRFTPLVYNFALNHVAGNCRISECLLCELGFLFDMLVKADGQHCRAYNFSRTLATIPQASALGLLEDETGLRRVHLGLVLQSFNRFLLERISFESRNEEIASFDRPASHKFDKVVGMSLLSTVKCSSCGHESARRGNTYAVDLQYPKATEGQTSFRNNSKNDKRGNTNVSFANIVQQSVETKSSTRGWCDKCRKYNFLTSTRHVKSLSPVLSFNTAIDSPAERQIWSQKKFLPTKFHASITDGKFQVQNVLEDEKHLGNVDGQSELYELVGMVVEVNFGPLDNHMVALIRVPVAAGQKEWYLFNDFMVRPLTESECLKFDYTWKTPVTLVYQSSNSNFSEFDSSWKDRLDMMLLYQESEAARTDLKFDFSELRNEDVLTPGTRIAIDAEFVALQQEETEIKSDGTRSLIRPSKLSLARVSVVRGEGPEEGVAFIDDYIRTTDNIVDYLTAFSGINIGDLDPGRSSKPLVPLKIAYKKLWLLLNLGCIFVGHGLANDFRTINIQVPRNQVIDTVDLYFIKSTKRKLSLRFLAWYLLRENIQTETHDSIEDAKTALFLYDEYEKIKEQGGATAFENILNEIYNEGRAVNFRPPTAASDPILISTSSSGTNMILTEEVKTGSSSENGKIISSQIVEL
ncbi:ubiquitin carboxyl-terminal hydrolase-domain-containing protein [Lipomyces japonicus]|uniref:ubiquitin carboxyl-terminal hydrolase-domain-containing protein n=1 Tax=Lipomyces japonicus TaxID=56871 RepID=UPI0034CD8884